VGEVGGEGGEVGWVGWRHSCEDPEKVVGRSYGMWSCSGRELGSGLGAD